MEIKLTQGKIALIDDDDYNRVKNYSWCAHNEGSNWYAVTSIKNGNKHSTMRMHRLIMNAKPNKIMDHINGNGLDNRKENLRFCTHRENSRNKKAIIGRTSIYKGVSLRKSTGKFEAYININLKRKHLGFFIDEIQAAKAYNKAAKKHYGKFAKLNEI